MKFLTIQGLLKFVYKVSFGINILIYRILYASIPQIDTSSFRIRSLLSLEAVDLRSG